MRFGLFVVFLILFLLFSNFTESQEITLQCFVTTSCSYTDVFHISDIEDAHAEMNTQNNYPYKVCCRLSNGMNINVAERQNNGIIGLSYTTNAHAEIGNQTNYEYRIEMIPESGEIICELSYSCASYNTCLVSISDETDAHLGDCETNPYQRKICCSFGGLDITINSNSTKVEYGNDFKIYGRAFKAGIPFANAPVTVELDGKTECNLNTNSSGEYECHIKSPKRIDNLNITATVFDHVNMKSKTTSIQVKTYISYGYEKDKSDVVCVERPKIIQNEDGTIDIVMFNLCLWK
ncbi:MAG: hypothetical protein QXF12_07485 [Candidatus Aenigmatarchaeota archaeon]